jgi:L-rhamnose mutarotase
MANASNTLYILMSQYATCHNKFYANEEKVAKMQDAYIKKIKLFMCKEYDMFLQIYHLSDFGSIYKSIPKESRMKFWFAVIRNDKHYKSLQDNIFKCFAHAEDMQYVEKYRKTVKTSLSLCISPEVLENIVMSYV